MNPDLVVRSLADVALANRFFGGSNAVLRELRRVLDKSRGITTMSLLDVGTGLGDIPMAAAEYARRRGVNMETVGMDSSEASLRARRNAESPAVRADALMLPFADASFDIVTCSQVLHHFPDDRAGALLRELNRVARVAVIVADIRRSWLAAAGIWLASFPLKFHPVSRHDGVVSVLRGFTPVELMTMVAAQAGSTPHVSSHPGFRVTASWAPGTGAR